MHFHRRKLEETMIRPDNSFKNITIAILVATLIVSAVFVMYPQLDLYVSALFFNPSGQFPAAHSTIANLLREGLILGMWSLVIMMLIFLICSLTLRSSRYIPLRIWGYPVVVSIAGTLILVNAILKNNWGRARPFTVTEFGGDLDFTPAYYLSDQCITNCSFTSGEGAAIATVTITAGVLLWRNVQHSRLLAVLIPLFILGAGLRVAKGMHFISDTLLSALFCALIALFFYWLMDIGAHRDKLTWRNAKGDLRNLIKFQNPLWNKPKK